MKTREKMAHAVTSTARAVGKEIAGTGGEKPTRAQVSQAQVQPVLDEWQSTPRKVAERMIEKYGLPHEATASRLIWFETGSWKRSIVYRDEVPHNFPKPHTDILEQFLDYRMPVERASEVIQFDGSIIVERTKGEVSVRCDMEEMNFLALNLMHEIVTGRRSVEDARKAYAETASGFVMGRPSPYTAKLLFDVADGGTADLDEVMIAAAAAHQTAEKAKDLVGANKP